MLIASVLQVSCSMYEQKGTQAKHHARFCKCTGHWEGWGERAIRGGLSGRPLS